MAKELPKLWQRKNRGPWYVTIKQRQYNCGNDRKRAERERAQLLIDHLGTVPTGADGLTVADLFGRFLDSVKRKRAAKTYEWYKLYLDQFAAVYGRYDWDSVTSTNLETWVRDRYCDSAPTTQHNATRAVITAFNWAWRKERLISVNPVYGAEKPTPEHRSDTLSQVEYDRLMSGLDVHGEPMESDPLSEQCFRDIVELLWLTGARPDEIRRIEERHLVDGEIRFPKHEAKGKTQKRKIPLTERAAEIIQRNLAEKLDDAPEILRNSKGRPWTNYALNALFQRMSLQFKRRLYPYMLRHSFATDAVEKQVPTIDIAKAMGHVNTRMIEQVYAHPGADHRKKTVNAIRGRDDA